MVLVCLLTTFLSEKCSGIGVFVNDFLGGRNELVLLCLPTTFFWRNEVVSVCLSTTFF